MKTEINPYLWCILLMPVVAYLFYNTIEYFNLLTFVKVYFISLFIITIGVFITFILYIITDTFKK